MKRISIRMRVTLWFTALMSLLALLVLVFLYLAGQSSVKTGLRNQLVNTIISSLDEIEYEDGKIEPDADLDYFIGGVYLSIYDAEGRPHSVCVQRYSAVPGSDASDLFGKRA